MTQEEKQLLLKDLCGRLPYGVKVLIPECRQDIATLIGIDDKLFTVKYDESIIYCPFSINIKPYLRPMSSMTDEEKTYIKNRWGVNEFGDIELEDNSNLVDLSDIRNFIDWLNKKMFDYRGLIPKGAALEAPDEMYKMEE